MASPAATAVTPENLFKGKRLDVFFAAAMMGIVGLLVLPIPTPLLSMFLAANLSLAVMVLLVALYTREPLEFNTFPSLLLVTTLIRLGLNVATTRAILLDADAGAIIETFGRFVVGGNFVVGIVVFTILLIIQLVVVTKGAGRISEVAARFTLDAMPGKQMAIDADLNAGLISESEARERRAHITQEAEFYGAMDGAAKFVKGDAIAGLIITIINIVAGFIIGMTMMGMDAGQSLQTFAILTVGDGLVSQIPSLLIAVGSGMLVTKSRSEKSIGEELPEQFLAKPKALPIAAAMIFALGIVPGMPTLAFWPIAIALLVVHRFVGQKVQEISQAKVAAAEEEAATTEKAPQNVEEHLGSDRIVVELGYRLISMVDADRGGTLLQRVTNLRHQLARENGLLIPAIRIKDNIQLPPNAYRIVIGGEPVARGDLLLDRLLAIDGGGTAGTLPGEPAQDPAFGLPAIWIEEANRSEAEALGFAVADPAAVFITHLTQVLKQQAGAILNREDVQKFLEVTKRDSPALAKEIEDGVKPGLIQKVIGMLLEERVPITNLEKILETISDYRDMEPAQLCEQVRARLGAGLLRPFLTEEGRLPAVILAPEVEQALAQGLHPSGGQLGIAPQAASQLMDQLGEALQRVAQLGHEPVLLTTAGLRRPLRQITLRFYPELAVISYAELGSSGEVDVLETISPEALQPQAQQ